MIILLNILYFFSINKVDKVSKIVDYLRLNGVFLTEVNHKICRKFKVESILNNDVLASLFTNSVFNLAFWGKCIEIEVLECNTKKSFKYTSHLDILKYIKKVVVISSFYNEDFLNKKIDKLSSALSNKIKEMVNFFKPHGLLIDKLIKSGDVFTMMISLGYIQLIIKYNTDDSYYLTISSYNNYMKVNKFDAILNMLYKDGNNFWIESPPFYEKLSDVIDTYLTK